MKLDLLLSDSFWSLILVYFIPSPDYAAENPPGGAEQAEKGGASW